MSPLLDVQRRFRELGRIRMGAKATAQNGKTYPKKLGDWRLTSSNADLLAVAAEVYGGTVQEWTGAPTEGKQWELLTGTDRLDVLVPPGEPLSQNWEMWSGGGCVRRCNGHVQQNDQPCACPADLATRSEMSKSGGACKATTRLSVVLPRIPDIGVWRMESHGMNAAVELPGTVDILRTALDGGALVPAQLRIDQRTSKKDGETRHFIVPVLELPTVTTAELMGGSPAALNGPTRAIGSGGGESPVSPLPQPVPLAAPARSLPPLPHEEVVGCLEPTCDYTGPDKINVADHLVSAHGYSVVRGKVARPTPPAPTPPRPPADNGASDAPAGAGPPSTSPAGPGTEGAGPQGAPAAPPPVPNTLVSAAQVRLIHVLLGKLGVGEDDKHRYCGSLIDLPEPPASLNDLSKSDARRLIDALQAEAEGVTAK